MSDVVNATSIPDGNSFTSAGSETGDQHGGWVWDFRPWWCGVHSEVWVYGDLGRRVTCKTGRPGGWSESVISLISPPIFFSYVRLVPSRNNCNLLYNLNFGVLHTATKHTPTTSSHFHFQPMSARFLEVDFTLYWAPRAKNMGIN